MRIAICEWVCGGGLATESVGGDFESLQAEGWAMLSCLVGGCLDAGHEVVVPIDKRLLPRLDDFQSGVVSDQVSIAGTLTSLPQAPSATEHEALLGWHAAAEVCDLTVIIAPEIEDVLSVATQSFQDGGIPTLNCTGGFLQIFSDKWRTAEFLHRHDFAHPPTTLAAEWDNQKEHHALQQIRGTESDFSEWVLKPKDGAGCHGLQIVTDTRQHVPLLPNPMDWIVQPFVRGAAYSRSAIVDTTGRWHWLPVMTQDFDRERPDDGSPATALVYRGGRLAESVPNETGLIDLLRRFENAVQSHCDLQGALGWIGLDLLCSEADDSWSIIEVNPRCTTSLIELQAAYDGNLVAELLSAGTSNFPGLQHRWNARS